MATIEITEGWTGDLDFTLTADGAAVDLTGATVELVLTTGSTVVDTSGDVTVVDAATGSVRYTPDPADLTPGQYRAHWKVTDGGKVVFYPNGRGDLWIVYRV